jgi:nitrate reductase gamma subunit
VYQLHAMSALVFIAMWPFTRLVHVWSAPVAYLWRPYIVYRRRARRTPLVERIPFVAASREHHHV